jgi:YVTN family beta-propeller protein
VDVVASNIAVAAGSAWVIEPEPFNAVDRITPGSPTAQSIAIPQRRSASLGVTPALRPSCLDFAGLTSLGSRIWFVCGGLANTFGGIDPTNDRVSEAEYHGPAGPTVGVIKTRQFGTGGAPLGGTAGMAAVGGRLWVLNHGNTVTEYDPAAGTAEETVPGLTNPVGIAGGHNSVWITNFDSGTVTRLELVGPGLPPAITTIPVGRRPAGIAYGDGAVWVANTGDHTISRIDAKSARVVATIKVGSVPAAIAFGAGRVWVTTRSSTTVANG